MLSKLCVMIVSLAYLKVKKSEMVKGSLLGILSAAISYLLMPVFL